MKRFITTLFIVGLLTSSISDAKELIKRNDLISVYVAVDSTSITFNTRVYHVDFEIKKRTDSGWNSDSGSYANIYDSYLLINLKEIIGVEDVKEGKYHFYITKGILYDWENVQKQIWKVIAEYNIPIDFSREFHGYYPYKRDDVDCQVILTDEAGTFEEIVYTTERVK